MLSMVNFLFSLSSNACRPAPASYDCEVAGENSGHTLVYTLILPPVYGPVFDILMTCRDPILCILSLRCASPRICHVPSIGCIGGTHIRVCHFRHRLCYCERFFDPTIAGLHRESKHQRGLPRVAYVRG